MTADQEIAFLSYSEAFPHFQDNAASVHGEYWDIAISTKGLETFRINAKVL